MSYISWPLITILVLLYAVLKGWRKGFVHQVASLLGLGFAIVAARMFCDPLSQWLAVNFPALGWKVAPEYTFRILASGIIFTGVYAAFFTVANILRSALRMLHAGAVNSIAGAAFCLLKYAFVLSVIFNIILALSPNSSLGKLCTSGDGNVVELVMNFAPAMFGTEGPDDFEHRQQMEEAKSISLDAASPDVLISNRYRTFSRSCA